MSRRYSCDHLGVCQDLAASGDTAEVGRCAGCDRAAHFAPGGYQATAPAGPFGQVIPPGSAFFLAPGAIEGGPRRPRSRDIWARFARHALLLLALAVVAGAVGGWSYLRGAL